VLVPQCVPVNVERERERERDATISGKTHIFYLFTWRLGLNVSGNHVDVVTNVLGFVAIGFDRGECMLLL
jgi:hypothetical protein